MSTLKINPLTDFVKIVVRVTLNNVFFTAITGRGNTLLWFSCGSSGFKGPRRSTPLAAEQAAKQFSEQLVALGFKHTEVLILSRLNSRTKAAVRGLVFSRKLFVRIIRFLPPQSHNGLRFPKVRRV